ncbi:MAG: SAM-dependent methyltransferase, partial [Mycobacteriales bacterium]
MDWEFWQQSWDAQQQAYLPDREERFVAMLDAVESACGDAPRVLDLAGGTGSITRRLLARSPRATSV